MRARVREVVGLLLVAAALAFAVGTSVDGGDGDDLARSRAVEERIRATIRRVRDAVVTISAEQKEVLEDGTGKQVTSGGSGVIYSADGLILTNDHVTIGAPKVNVGLRDGRTLTGTVLGRDRAGDVAVVRVKAKDLPFVAPAESDSLVEGQTVLALGNPFGLSKDDHEPAATFGIISGLHRFQGGEKVYGDAIQIDAAVNPGNSGGPLFDLDGRFIGINGRISIRASEKKNVGVGFAVPIDQIKLVLADLERGNDVTHGYLGVRFRGETDGDGRLGVEIVAVLAGTPADRAGLRKGDRVLQVNGKDVSSPVRLENYLSVLPLGAEVTLLVDRRGTRLDVKTALGRKPGS